MKNTLIRSSCFSALAFLALSGCAARTTRWSFPSVALQPGERITGYELSIQGGTILAAEQIAPDWDFLLDSDLSWNPRVHGACHHGASALGGVGELPRLEMKTDASWRVEGHILVTVDFEKTRKIPFQCGEK